MRIGTRAIILLAAVFTALWMAGLHPVLGSDDPRKAEIKMGQEASADLEQDVKFISDPKLVDRVTRVGNAIAAVANSEAVPATYGSSQIYKFDYTFKVIDDDSVNAFSLPGGTVYVYNGLLKYVDSDHELAGVLAHEIAHSAHHHMTYLLKQQSKLDGQLALVLIAGMLARVNGDDLGHLLIGAQLVRIARSSAYGQKAEADADATGVMYALKAGYNPVGALTVLEKLARDYTPKVGGDLGIMQDHPITSDRCKAILAEIKSLGLPINRRAVSNALKAVVEPATIANQQVFRVKLGDAVLFEPASIVGADSQHRADAMAVSVNQLLDSEPILRDVTLSADGSTVLGRGAPIVVVTPQDGSLVAKSQNEVGAQAARVLELAVWSEMVGRMN